MAKKIGKSLCITSAKGGVGKTMTLLNLAGTYCILGKKTLIIDLDLTGGAIAVALNKGFEKSLYNIALDIDSNQFNSLNDYVTKYNDYIDFLASPKDPRQAGKIDTNHIDLILDRALLSYDMVLIDTTHNINELNLTVMERADNILFIVTNDPFDLKNLKSMLSIFHNLGKTNYKVLLNNSSNPFKNYFSLYDIKNILKANIDYTLSNKFYISNIDDYIMNGKIILLEDKFERKHPNEYTTFMTMASDFILDNKEEQHEK